MLGGEHLGGRQQHSLPPGIDDLQHCAQRHDRLAGSDLALQQPVHRVLTGQLRGQHLTHLLLASGQREGQCGVECGGQPAGPARAGRGRPTGRLMTPQREGQLYRHRLVPLQPVLRGGDLGTVVGAVHRPQCRTQPR